MGHHRHRRLHHHQSRHILRHRLLGSRRPGTPAAAAGPGTHHPLGTADPDIADLDTVDPGTVGLDIVDLDIVGLDIVDLGIADPDTADPADTAGRCSLALGVAGRSPAVGRTVAAGHSPVAGHTLVADHSLAGRMLVGRIVAAGHSLVGRMLAGRIAVPQGVVAVLDSKQGHRGVVGVRHHPVVVEVPGRRRTAVVLLDHQHHQVVVGCHQAAVAGSLSQVVALLSLAGASLASSAAQVAPVAVVGHRQSSSDAGAHPSQRASCP